MTTTTLTADEFLAALKRISHAMAKDEARPVIACMSFEAEGDKMRLVACDNYRIAWVDIWTEKPVAWEGSILVRRGDIAMIIQWLSKTLRSVASLEMSVDTATNRMTLRIGAWSITVPLQDGQYPNYRQVVPDPVETPTVSLNTLYLAEFGRAALAERALGVRVYITEPLKPVLLTYRNGGEVIMPIKTTDFGG